MEVRRTPVCKVMGEPGRFPVYVAVQDVGVVFQMFDVNNDGNIHLPEFEEITDALQQRLKRVSAMQRTGAHIQQYAIFIAHI